MFKLEIMNSLLILFPDMYAVFPCLQCFETVTVIVSPGISNLFFLNVTGSPVLRILHFKAVFRGCITRSSTVSPGEKKCSDSVFSASILFFISLSPVLCISVSNSIKNLDDILQKAPEYWILFGSCYE